MAPAADSISPQAKEIDDLTVALDVSRVEVARRPAAEEHQAHLGQQ